MSGKVTVAASRKIVWAALNDPEILRQTIPGCEDIQQIDATHLTAKVKQKIGPISASFSGDIELSDLKELESYRISGEGSGGSAGFAKGGASVHLADDESGGTVLSYEAEAQVGGKMAQIGSRLIDSTAKKLADKFFTNFKFVVEQKTHAHDQGKMPTDEEIVQTKDNETVSSLPKASDNLPRWVAVGVGVLAVGVTLFLIFG